jgi:SNF2 family DNA or RNA helicase
MLETIREYALERLGGYGDADDLRMRHASFCRRLAEDAYARRFDAEVEWSARLDLDHENLRAGLGWLQTQDVDGALELAGALGWYWLSRGLLEEGRGRLSEALSASGISGRPRARALTAAGALERRGDGARLARLRRRIKPLVKRRSKELVAADLPAKQEQTLLVDLHPRHRKLYDTYLQRERQKVLGLLSDFDRNRFTILRSLTLLRQLSLHPGLVDSDSDAVPCAKLGALAEQLGDVVGGGHRALVFSQFTRFLAEARDCLERERIGYCYLDGRTRQRARVLERFRRGDDPVFLISLKAGGLGLNLTEADYCFLLDPWWNPAAENQAIDRAHRIGQIRPVMVYRLIARDTIEEKVVALARRKAQLFRGVMDEGDLFASTLTADDIRGLLE